MVAALGQRRLGAVRDADDRSTGGAAVAGTLNGGGRISGEAEGHYHIFGSDAHFSTMIADYSNIMPLVEKAEFPDELVLNYQPEKFMAYLKPTPEK